MTERQNIEWKQSWHDDYLRGICGLANAIGGVICVGKDDSGKVVGLDNARHLLETIPSKIRNSMGILCDINLLEEGALPYLEIKVNPYSVPVSLRGRCYYRSGSSTLELTGVELNEFLLKKAGKTWDDVIEEGATIADIDAESIAKFVLDSQGMGRLPETAGLSTLQILEKLQLSEGNKLKRGAIVLFGKNPSRFFPSLEVRIGRFGVDAADLRFQEVVEGNLVQILDQVPIQLNNKFLIRPISFEGMHRIEKDSYPQAAIREMLLNALVHRTYMGAHVQLRVYDDRLTIWNEGALPQGLTLDDLKKEHPSRPRNPKIAKVCFMAGYIDTWGRGTLKILDACKKAGLPEPEITESKGGIAVTLYARKEENPSGEVRNDFGMISERIRIDFGKEIAMAFEIITKHPEYTSAQIASELGKTPRTVENYIAKLKKAGFIIRKGPKLGGNWEITVKL
jgi:ATP-dependent DNA helicase RecG